MFQIVQTNYNDLFDSSSVKEPTEKVVAALIEDKDKALEELSKQYVKTKTSSKYNNRNYTASRVSKLKYHITGNQDKPVVEFTLQKMTKKMINEYHEYLEDLEDQRFMERQEAMDKALANCDKLSDSPEDLVHQEKFSRGR